MRLRRFTGGAAWLACCGLAAAAQPLPDAALLKRGEEVYARCAGCHAIEAHRTGPAHCGLFGRQAGAAAGFDAYSQAMRRSHIVWSGHELDAFLRDPAARVPGTTMGYAGVKDDVQRTDLIAWLKTVTRPGACTPPH
jgi:cytochrome c